MRQHLSVGHILYCDLCPKPDEGITRFEVYNTSELYATLAWIGSKPDLTLVNEYQKVCNDVKKGVLVSQLSASVTTKIRLCQSTMSLCTQIAALLRKQIIFTTLGLNI